MKNKKLLIAIGIVILILVIILLLSFVLKKEEYNVVFDTDGGTNVSPQLIIEDGVIEKPVDPEKEGYEFAGWYYNGELFDFSTTVTEDITLEARWNAIDLLYTVTFNTLGGTSIDDVKVALNGKVSRPDDPEKEGYTFVEWQLNGVEYDFDSPVTNNIVITALWEENAIYYTVTYDSNGGTVVTSQRVLENELATTPSNPTRSGYTFAGWRLNGRTFDFSTPITSDITLVASWTRNQTSTPTTSYYTVTFNSNGGSSVASQTIIQNGVVSRPNNPTRTGYTFTGWTLNGKTYNFSTPVNSNITLVANWSKNSDPTPQVNYYTVTFDSNGGSSVASQTIIQNGVVSRPNNPTRTGYTFTGWTLNGNSYNFSTPVTGNITLIATWQQIITYTYTIKNDPQSDIQKLVNVYRNGVDISADVLYIANSNGTNLGRYSRSANAIVVNNNEIDNIYQIMYNNEFIKVTKE